MNFSAAKFQYLSVLESRYSYLTQISYILPCTKNKKNKAGCNVYVNDQN